MTRRRLAAVPDRPQRVVLSVPVSALIGRGGDDFHSPEVQIGSMRRVTSGMQVVEVIDDDIDQTGRTFDREGIKRVRDLAEANAIDAIAVYNVARFGRNTMEGLQFLNWLADRGVTILSATEHIDTSTPSGRWLLTNMLAVAEMRSDEIGLEWSRVHAHRAKAGKAHGTPPTGYVKGEDGKLVPHPTFAPAITQAFTDYADDKDVDGDVKRIRRTLRAVTGLNMSGPAFKKILQNRAYLGEVRVGTVVTEGAHEPLVDNVTWQRVQTRLRRDSRTPARLAEPQYALSGLLYCGVCEKRGNHRRADAGKIRMFCREQEENRACAGFGRPEAAKVRRWSSTRRGHGLPNCAATRRS